MQLKEEETAYNYFLSLLSHFQPIFFIKTSFFVKLKTSEKNMPDTESSNQVDDHHNRDETITIDDDQDYMINDNDNDDIKVFDNVVPIRASRGTNNVCEIHRVCMPPFVPTTEKLKRQLFEIFFPDDPLSAFRNRTLYEKVVLGVQGLFHVFQWMPHYDFTLFRSDLIAGITISSLAIPQVIIQTY